MIIYRNKYIPFQGFKSIFLFGILFVKNDAKIKEVDMRHERIHSKQYVEIATLFLLLLLPMVFFKLWWLWLLLSLFGFYIIYGLEWLARYAFYRGDANKAYKNTSFEREAYSNQSNIIYLKTRKRFSWIKYIKSK